MVEVIPMRKDSYYEYPILGEMITKKHSTQFREISPNKHKMDGHQVFVLGGNMTTDETSATRQGVIVDNLLKLLYDKAEHKDGKPIRDDIHILSFAYGILEEDDLSGGFTDGTIRSIADKMLMQKCTNADGSRVSLDEAKRGLSQITFFSFCHGAIVANKIIAAFQESLAEKGYEDNEIRQMLDVMGQVSWAPEFGVMNLIPTIRFDSKEDKTVHNYRQLLLKSEGIFNSYEPIEFRRFPQGRFWDFHRDEAAESINVFSFRMLNAFDKSLDEHSVGYLKRNADWSMVARDVNGYPKKHEDEPGEFKVSPNADAMSQMAGWALSRLVDNGIQNYHSSKYIPRTPFHIIMNEMQSIYTSFDYQSLM